MRKYHNLDLKPHFRLRRLRKLAGVSESFDAIYEAAGSVDWAKFV